MFKKLPYDTVKSFEPVMLTHVLPLMLVVHPSLPVKNVQELIAYGKANPGKLSFAQRPGRRTAHVRRAVQEHGGGRHAARPLQGQHCRPPDLLSGRTSLMFDTVTAINPHVKSGALRALAVTTASAPPPRRTCPRWPKPG